MEKLNLQFKDELGTNLNKYGITESGGVEKEVTLRRLANITQKGTPLNATNLNAIINKANEIIDEINKVDFELDTGNGKPSDKLKIGGIFFKSIAQQGE